MNRERGVLYKFDVLVDITDKSSLEGNLQYIMHHFDIDTIKTNVGLEWVTWNLDKEKRSAEERRKISEGKVSFTELKSGEMKERLYKLKISTLEDELSRCKDIKEEVYRLRLELEHIKGKSLPPNRTE